VGNIASFGFSCVHKDWSRQAAVRSGGMPLVFRYKASEFPLPRMHWSRVRFRNAWLHD